MTSTTFDSDGRVVEQTVDNGDGTGTRTSYDAAGEIVSVEALSGLPIPEPPPPPTALDRLAAMPPSEAAAMATLALGIAGQADDLWTALLAIAPSNTARPAIEIVAHHALVAGLALIDTPTAPPEETQP